MKVRIVSKTVVDPSYVKYLLEDLQVPEEFREVLDNPEGLIAYIARVSSSNQANDKYAGLIRYCMSHGHWSILEMCNVVFEIETSRAISPQILRHRSFSFQEFSQRYAAVDEHGIEIYAARRQDSKNRQNSINDISKDVQFEWEQRQRENWQKAFEDYTWALDNGIAKECARMVLPLQTKTRLFMNGTLRSWVHYISLRADKATQFEHQEIAQAIKNQLCESFPIVSEAAQWNITTK